MEYQPLARLKRETAAAYQTLAENEKWLAGEQSSHITRTGAQKPDTSPDGDVTAGVGSQGGM
jgi:hypothetical protein